MVGSSLALAAAVRGFARGQRRLGPTEVDGSRRQTKVHAAAIEAGVPSDG